MEKKYLLISMEDKRAKKLSQVLGNNTCKKIIDLLAEKESSEKDISDILKIPMNTVEYNLKKLLEVELIEKTKNFFWSQKGKKIVMYKLSNKSIIISPKSSMISSKLKSILPVAIFSGLGAIFLRYLFLLNQPLINLEKNVAFGEAAQIASLDARNIFFAQPSPIWIWFLGGALFSLIIFTILNWRKL
jgi:DNA-binding transcriptional ArsR family regulator